MRTKIITILLIIFVQFSAISQPQGKRDELPNLNLLQRLLSDGSVAPNVTGHIFHKKPHTKIASVAEFENELREFQTNLRNRITILQFWEMRCQYSKLVLPMLENIYANYKDEGVQAFAVNTNDFGIREFLVEFLNEYSYIQPIFDAETMYYFERREDGFYRPFNIPILFAPEVTKRRYGVSAFPAVFIIDKQGLVYTAMIGYFEGYERWLSQVLDGLLAE